MKPVLSIFVSKLFLAILALALTQFAHGTECTDHYFSPTDQDNQYPLRRPHKEFASAMQGAKAGNVTDQLNMAAFYEAGYLVAKCTEKAAYWYSLAAKTGSKPAIEWVKQNEALNKLMQGPECIGDSCFGAKKEGRNFAVFYAGHNGHYFAPLTINGITATGMIDTGASAIAMSEEMARKFGLDAQSGTVGQAMTANGIVATKNIVVPELDVSGIKLRDVRVSIGISGGILIGMSFLRRVSIAMTPGMMTISK
jgi:clan AA aspartic protease (TIGR02281 family)